MTSNMSDAGNALDEALGRLFVTGPEYGGGLSNHGPMACEALARLGKADAIAPWLDAYTPRLDEAPGRGRPLTDDEWPGALGAQNRYPDWLALFERELDDRPWVAVVGAWAPKLAPGAMGAATHGLIRTAHAVRALSEAATPERLHELAAALAYWSSIYLSLQGTPEPNGTTAAEEALERVPVLPADARREGLITGRAVKASQLKGFGDAVDSLVTPSSVAGSLSELTSVMARWYLANCEHSAIAFVHTVTAPAALRLLLPYVPKDMEGTAFSYVWQACAAIRSAFGMAVPGAGDERDEEPFPREELIGRAIEIGGAHAIKLTEACLREDSLRPNPAYLLAAADVGRRLDV